MIDALSWTRAGGLNVEKRLQVLAYHLMEHGTFGSYVFWRSIGTTVASRVC